MKKKILSLMIFLLMILSSGCACFVTTDGEIRKIRGVGLDINLHPFPGFRCGFFEYSIHISKEEQKISSENNKEDSAEKIQQ